MSNPSPSIHRITREDITSDERLGQLYIEAIRHEYWKNSSQDMLDFAALAEKALHDDTQGTPGALFAVLLKRQHRAMITQAVETRAMQRFPSHVREDLVYLAAAKSRLPGTPVDEVHDTLVPHDVGYSHAVMVQCFFPQRAIASRVYDTTHGRASLSIEAGRITNPHVLGHWVECDVPSGPKPRLILPYIVGEAIRNASPEIDLGPSLRNFMARIGMPITGHNGKALTAQVQNIAAAHIVIGEWKDHHVSNVGGKLAKEFTFWLEHDLDQHTIWTPTMTLSNEFFDAIQHHRVPIDTGHLARLARSPRRMDVYVWLSYRTARIAPNRTEAVSLRALHDIFGPDIARLADFGRRLRSDLRAIHAVYPYFRVSLSGDSDTLRLQRSSPPVPFTRPVSLPPG